MVSIVFSLSIEFEPINFGGSPPCRMGFLGEQTIRCQCGSESKGVSHLSFKRHKTIALILSPSLPLGTDSQAIDLSRVALTGRWSCFILSYSSLAESFAFMVT